MFDKWKRSRDEIKTGNAIRILNSFWEKENATATVLHWLMYESNLNDEKLDIIANIIGYEAHMRGRENRD